jgi:hypothetical protein
MYFDAQGRRQDAGRSALWRLATHLLRGGGRVRAGFFDARDLAQVKYEMLRQVRVESRFTDVYFGDSALKARFMASAIGSRETL